MCAKGLMSAVHVCLCSRSAVSLSTFDSGTCRGRLRSAAAVQRGDPLGNTQMSTETSAAVRDAVFIGGADLLSRNAARPEKTPEHIYLQARARARRRPAFHVLPRSLFTIIVEGITHSLHTYRIPGN